MSLQSDSLSVKDYLNTYVKNISKRFHALTMWSAEQREDFRVLVDALESPGSTTKETGDILERVVEFIISNSYFFDIYKNIRTKTNEIDEIAFFTEEGKIALDALGLSRNLIPITQDIFLGECKNYASALDVTYVGKFYSLLKATNTRFGILFTRNGLTGSSDGFQDGYGLTKILRIYECSNKSLDKDDFYIITFTLDDYKKMIDGTSFFELIEAKKLESQFGANFEKFILDNRHCACIEVKEAIDSLHNVGC